MGQWYRLSPGWSAGDFIHPMPAGAKNVGNLLYQALFDGYNQFKGATYAREVCEVTIDSLPK